MTDDEIKSHAVEIAARIVQWFEHDCAETFELADYEAMMMDAGLVDETLTPEGEEFVGWLAVNKRGWK